MVGRLYRWVHFATHPLGKRRIVDVPCHLLSLHARPRISIEILLLSISSARYLRSATGTAEFSPLTPYSSAFGTYDDCSDDLRVEPSGFMDSQLGFDFACFLSGHRCLAVQQAKAIPPVDYGPCKSKLLIVKESFEKAAQATPPPPYSVPAISPHTARYLQPSITQKDRCSLPESVSRSRCSPLRFHVDCPNV